MTVSASRPIAVNVNTGVLEFSSNLPGLPGDAVYPVAGEYATPTRSGLNTAAPGQNLCYWTWLPLAASGTVVRIGVEVTAAANPSSVLVGMHLDNGSGRPGTKLLSEQTLDTSTATGLVEATVSQVVSPPGVWLFVVSQTASRPTLRRVGAATQHWAARTRTSGTVVTQFNLTSWSGTQSGTVASNPTVVGDDGSPLVVVRF